MFYVKAYTANNIPALEASLLLLNALLADYPRTQVVHAVTTLTQLVVFFAFAESDLQEAQRRGRI